MVALAILFIAVLSMSAIFFVQGWIIFFRFGSKPCDQPLKWWLLLTLLVVPGLQLGAHFVRLQCLEPSRLSRVASLAVPGALLLGAWLLRRSRTCAETDPELYRFVRVLLIFQFTAWALVAAVSCSLVSTVLWLHRRGLLES